MVVTISTWIIVLVRIVIIVAVTFIESGGTAEV